MKDLPAVAAAWESGELSGGQVQAIVGNVPERLVGQFAAHEAEVVPALVGLSVRDTATAMRHWAAHAEALTDQPEPPEQESTFHLSQTLDGVWVADGVFDAEGGALIHKAIELASGDDYSISLAQRRADALKDVAAYYLDNQALHLGGRYRPHVNVIVDVENLRGELVMNNSRSTGRPRIACCATASSTGCWSTANKVEEPRSSRSRPPPAASRPRCGRRWSSGIGTAGSRAVTVRQHGRKVTMCSGSASMARRSSTISCSSVEVITASCTDAIPASWPSSSRTEPSTSSIDTVVNG